MSAVTTWYLEQTAPEQLRRSPPPPGPPAQLQRAEIPSPTLNRHFYAAVGTDWRWTDRLPWTLEQWRRHVERPDIQTWILYQAGTPAGYLELERAGTGDVQLAYFGLLPEFLGRQLGGWFLSESIARAWEWNARRVWVHTCSLDHPAALANYQARGMRIYQVETKAVAATGA
jgi:GNAT superfamily N-acetyltransferase